MRISRFVPRFPSGSLDCSPRPRLWPPSIVRNFFQNNDGVMEFLMFENINSHVNHVCTWPLPVGVGTVSLRFSLAHWWDFVLSNRFRILGDLAIIETENCVSLRINQLKTLTETLLKTLLINDEVRRLMT